MTQFIDFLGNPINVGDVVVYPTASGSSSAQMNLALVDTIDPIVELGPNEFVHQSQLKKKDPTLVSYPRKWVSGPGGSRTKRVNAPERAYRLAVKKLADADSVFGTAVYENPERRFYITNVDRVVVVGELGHSAYHRARAEQGHAALARLERA